MTNHELTAGSRRIIANIVGRCHVSDPDSDVIATVSEKCPNAEPKLLRAILREAIKAHRANQRLYKQVMTGGF